jgi:hypothetical protein
MNHADFNDVIESLDKMCDDVLRNRQEAYADEDRLSNFKQIAMLTGLTPEQVCIVLHAKHFVALAKAIGGGHVVNLVQYITDIINYQRLLYALLAERAGNE